MLSPRQRLTVGLVAAGTALAIFLLAAWASKPVPQVSLPTLAAQFDGASAVAYTRNLAEGFPDRVTGSVGSRRAAEYLRAEFLKLGFHVDSPTFSMWLHGERVQGENIVASLDGDSPETVAIIAHYDGQFTSHQAAEDNASGVGVLLELARVLRARAHHRGLMFVATDAEEWGMIGALRLIERFKSQNTIAVLSIDYLNSGPAPALEMTCSGQFGGYTPLWLRELMVEAGKAQGAGVTQPSGIGEWVERALEVSFQDQGPLVRGGIPALNIATLTKEVEASRARYHTPLDVFRDFDPASFKMLGAALEQAATGLDALQPPNDEGMSAFLLSPGRFIPGGVLEVMLALGLVPIVLAAIFATSALRLHKIRPTGWLFFSPLSWLIPPGLAALVLYGLVWTNLLKRYELYPATPKDPFLYQLPLAVILPLLVVLAGGFARLRVIRRRLEPDPKSFASRKTILFLWVTCLSLAAFFTNPYALWFFLGGFVYAALLLIPPRGTLARGLNALLIIGATLPFAALLYFFGREIFLGWRILWYLVLQAAYGVWSPVAVALFLLSMALWVQLFWLSVLRKPTVE